MNHARVLAMLLLLALGAPSVATANDWMPKLRTGMEFQGETDHALS